MHRILWCLLAIVFMGWCCSKGAKAAGSWEVITTANAINDMIFDGEILWCATDGGAVRWDIRTMTCERYNDPRIFTSAAVLSVALGSDGSVWFGLAKGGLVRYIAGIWEPLSIPSYNIHNMVVDFADFPVTDLAFDHFGDLWCTTEGGGAVRFDGESWQHYNEYFGGLISDRVFGVEIGPDNTIWFGTHSGISHNTRTSWETWSYNIGIETHDHFGRVYAFGFEPSGAMWASGYVTERYADGVWEPLKPVLGYASTTRDIECLYNGTTWIATSAGLWYWDGAAWTIYDADEGLGSSDTRTVKPDPNGMLWCGTANGLSRFDGDVWTTFYAPVGLADNRAKIIAARGDGSVWIGSGNGLSHFDGLNWKIFNENDGFTHPSVIDIAVNAAGDIWVASAKEVSGKVIASDADREEADRIAGTHPECVLNRWNGSSWDVYDGMPLIDAVGIDAEGNPLYYDDEHDAIVWFDGTEHARIEFLPGGDGFDFYCDEILVAPNGDVWLKSGYTNIVWRFSEAGWASYIPNAGISNAPVSDLDITSNGTVWCATRNEFLRFDGEQWELQFKHPNILKMEALDDGEIMFLNEDGLYRTESGEIMIEEYCASLGVTDPLTAAWEDAGQIWLGTTQGVLHYIPDPSGVAAQVDGPVQFEISSVYPNPFNVVTTIEYTLVSSTQITMKIFTVTGQCVRTLVTQQQNAGRYRVVWNGRDEHGIALGSGVYLVVLDTNIQRSTRRMVLLK